MMVLKSSELIWLRTAFMASSRVVLPFWTEMPMLTFSARSSSVANWKSPSVPAKFRMTRLSSFWAAAVAVGTSVQM